MLILGINPFTISYVRIQSFVRYGRHPLYYKFRNRKHPLLSIFWDGAPGEFDGIWRQATVEILGANGKVLKSVPCKSYKEAEQLQQTLNEQLTRFTESQ